MIQLLIYRLINLIFDLLLLLIIIRVLLSWIRPDPYNQLVRFIYEATEPILAPIRNGISVLIPAYRNMPVDFSPIIAIVLLKLLRNIIIMLLW